MFWDYDAHSWIEDIDSGQYGNKIPQGVLTIRQDYLELTVLITIINE